MMRIRKRLRFFVWCILILSIIATWLYVWDVKTKPEAERAAFIVAKRQILSNANVYRQHWMLNQQPSMMNIDGRSIQFTRKGWPITISNSRLDCDKWLALLWPDKQIFGENYSVKMLNQSLGVIGCEYGFPPGQVMILTLTNDSFMVEMNIK